MREGEKAKERKREREKCAALRVLRAETRLTVYRSCAIIRKQWLSQPEQGPRKMVIHHPKMIELSRFCIMKYMGSQRKCGRAYAEDQHRANKIHKC